MNSDVAESDEKKRQMTYLVDFETSSYGEGFFFLFRKWEGNVL